MDEKQAQKQAEKRATAKAGATVVHIAADYYTGGEYEQIRNAPVVGDLAKKAEEQVGERVASMPGSKRLGKAAKMLDDEGVIDAVDGAAGMIAGGGGNNPQDVEAFKNLGTNKADFGSSFSRNSSSEEELGLDSMKPHDSVSEPLGPEEGLDYQGLSDKSNKLKDGTIKDNKGLHLGKTKKDEVIEAGSFGDLKTKFYKKWKKFKFAIIAIGIGVGLFAAVFLIALLIGAASALLGSLSSYFGIPETDTQENMSEEEADGLLTNPDYMYDENGNPYTIDELVTTLKNDSTCSKVTFWNGIGDWFDGLDGEYGDLCAYLRYIESYIKDKEEAYKGVTLDRSLVLSTMFYGYASQVSPSEYDNPESADVIFAGQHYQTLINVLEDGLISKSDIRKIVDNTLADTSYTYYLWEVEVEKDDEGNPTKGIGKCVAKTVRDTRYSLKRYQIFMRFGETAAKAWEQDQIDQKGFSGTDEECLGVVSEDELLERVKTASGADKNELDKSVENAHDAMEDIKDSNISALEQKANTTSKSKDYFEPYVGSSGTITLDYRNGFAYNEFPGYKAAIDNPSIDVQYDEVTTPKIIEQTIEFIAQKKVTMNEILQFSDQDDPNRYQNNYSGYSSVILGAYCGDLLTAPMDQIQVYVTDCDGQYLRTTSLKEYVTGVAYREVSDSEDDYVKSEMLAAKNFALYRRNNYAKGTTIKMKSGNCDQAYCPMREGCHSKTSSLDCGGFKCTSYIPGAGGGTNTGASNAERIARYEAYYDELKDMLLVDKSTGKVAATYYTNVKQNQWYQKAKEGMNFTQIIMESYAADGKNYELIKCSDYDESPNSSSSSSSSETPMYGNGPSTEFTKTAPDLGKFYGFAYKDVDSKSILLNPEWVKYNITTIKSNCEAGNWEETYNVNTQAKDNFQKAFANVCKMLTEGVKLSDGTTCKYTIDDLQGGETYTPRKTITGVISDTSYGISQQWNYNKQYIINGKMFQPYGFSRNSEDYKAFVKALGKEEHCGNVNYILYKYAYQPAGFEWGGNWGTKDNVNAFNGMHFYVKYK